MISAFTVFINELFSKLRVTNLRNLIGNAINKAMANWSALQTHLRRL